MIPRRRTKCPFCKKLMVFQDEQQTVLHESPPCEQYLKLVAKHHGEAVPGPIIEDPEEDN